MLYAIFAALGAALLALDQWFKHWITVNLPLGETRPFLPGFMQLRTVHNYGAAWSSFSGMRWLLVAVTCCIVLAVADRVRLGYVVDMFELQFISYPVFNIADCCIVCGCIMGAVYYLWLYEKYDKKEVSNGDSDTPTE